MRENLCFKLHSRPSKFVLGGPPLAGKQRDLFDNLSQGLLFGAVRWCPPGHGDYLLLHNDPLRKAAFYVWGLGVGVSLAWLDNAIADELHLAARWFGSCVVSLIAY